MFLEISENSQENICTRVSLLIKLQAESCSFIKKETLAQVFFCEFCEMFKNIFYERALPVAASSNNFSIGMSKEFHSARVWAFLKQ